jgi:hypothetical protein
VTDWQVESLRFTLFRATPSKAVIPLWETLTREKPDKVELQPRANIITEQGTLVLGSLTHTSDPFRAEWTLSPSQEQQRRSTSFPTLGSFHQMKDQFLKMMTDWLTSEATPQTNRIALGSISLIIHDNRPSAYRQLTTFLHHVQIDIDNSTDFSYQINRPIESTVQSDLTINRLSKWSAPTLFGIGFLVRQKPQVIEQANSHAATRLELDINTSQYRQNPLPKEQLVPLLQELSHLADQIATEGDK